MTIPQETNRFKRAWIWFWYNDITRLFLLLIPTHLLFTLLPVLYLLHLVLGISHMSADTFRIFLFIFWGGPLLWAMVDNDYSNLRRIGLNEYREKLKT